MLAVSTYHQASVADDPRAGLTTDDNLGPVQNSAVASLRRQVRPGTTYLFC